MLLTRPDGMAQPQRKGARASTFAGGPSSPARGHYQSAPARLGGRRSHAVCLLRALTASRIESSDRKRRAMMSKIGRR